VKDSIKEKVNAATASTPESDIKAAVHKSTEPSLLEQAKTKMNEATTAA